MLNCPACKKNSAYWEDGSRWEHPKTECPKCKAVMDKKDGRKGLVITTTYSCPSCSHSYKDQLDLSDKAIKEPPDPDFEKDKYLFCFHDPKVLEEHRDAKRRYDGLREIFKEHEEKKANKHIYDAMKDIKQLKIPELTPLLAPVLEEAKYTEFRLDQPNIGREVTVGFSCLDSKSDRGDSTSRNNLKKLVNATLLETNWRLMSDGISYRLGYLSGRLKVYEHEEDIKALVMKDKKLKDTRVKKSDDGPLLDKNGNRIIKTSSGREVIL